MRPVLQNCWWTYVHRTIVVTLAIALTVVSIAGGHAADHHHTDEASTVMIVELDIASKAADSGDSHKCHLTGYCTVLGLPGTEYHIVPVARQRASFISVALYWQSLLPPPAFKPPIA